MFSAILLQAAKLGRDTPDAPQSRFSHVMILVFIAFLVVCLIAALRLILRTMANKPKG